MFKNRIVQMKLVKDEKDYVAVGKQKSDLREDILMMNYLVETQARNLVLAIGGLLLNHIGRSIHDLAVIRANSAAQLAYAVAQSDMYRAASEVAKK